jgi:sRNA-binding protein
MSPNPESTAPAASFEPVTPAEPAAPVESAAPAAPAHAEAAAPPPELSPAEVAARLAALFPALFGPGPARPLKLRIQADIQQRAPGQFSRKALSVFLHRHTTATAYLKALATLPQRFDLDGAPAGEVAAEHRDAAAAEVARRRAIVDARRAAARDAQRAAARAQREAARAAGAASAVAGGASDGATAPARPPRPPRPQPPQRPPQGSPRSPGARRPADASKPPASQRGPRGPREERPPRPQAGAPGGRPLPAPTPPAEPPDPAQRERALLLRAYETTTLTKANFCALKGIAAAELDAALALAREERAQRHGGGGERGAGVGTPHRPGAPGPKGAPR